MSSNREQVPQSTKANDAMAVPDWSYDNPEDEGVNYLTQADGIGKEEPGDVVKDPFSGDGSMSGSPRDYPDIQQRERERAARVEARRHPTNPVAKVFAKVVPYGGILASGLNLASSSIGAGIIAVPQACQSSGMVMAILYLVVVALLTVLSYMLIGEAGRRTGLRNYAQVVRALMGPGADYFLAFLLWFLSFGAEVSYVISLGDVFRAFLTNSSHVSDYWKSSSGVRVVMFLVWLGVMWPLTLPKEINSLRYCSVVAVFFIIFFVIVMVVHSIQGGFAGKDEIVAFQTGNSAIDGLGIFMFSFISQLNAYEVYEELYKPSVKRLTMASVVSTMLCFTLYIFAGVFGYLDFGSKVTGSSLALYDPVHETMMTIGYAGIILKLCVGYGLHMIPVRESVYHVLKIDVHVFPWWKNMIVVTIMGGCSMVLGLMLPKVTAVFGLVGGFSGGFIGYIFPALMFMYCGNFTMRGVGPFLYCTTWFLLFCGVIGAAFGTVPSFYGIAMNGFK